MENPEGDRYCRRRGRPRRNRSLDDCPTPRCYAPQCNPNVETEGNTILPEQMAVLNLIDLQGLSQEEASIVLGVSRKTVWRDIHEARRKVVDALVNGKSIEVSGCDRRLAGFCPQRNRGICPKEDGGICPRAALPTRFEGDDSMEQHPD